MAFDEDLKVERNIGEYKINNSLLMQQSAK